MQETLSALLSQALIAYTLEFDAELQRRAKALGVAAAPPSLAMWSNVLRFLDGKSVALRDLPKHSGLSKPATNIAVACLQRHGWIEVESGENRTRTVRLTPRGRSLLDVASDVAGDIDRKWRERFGAGAIDELLAALQRVTEEAPSLPWYPMALPNRGGTPTGA